MKRFIFFTLAILLSSFSAKAQNADVIEGKFPFHKKMAAQANGLAVIIEGSAEEVQEVMERVFLSELESGKLKNMKQGIMGVESAKMARMSERTLDYYYRIEPVAAQVQGPTKVSLFLSAGNNNFLDSDKYPEEMAAAKTMLQELQSKVEGYQLELAIEAQEARVKSALKEQEDYIKERDALLKQQEALVKEEQSIIKKQAELEQRLAEVKQEQIHQQQVVAEFAEKQSTFVERVAKERETLEELKKAQQSAPTAVGNK